jgi:eukaryotic-like serine/threonine-protein kinase
MALVAGTMVSPSVRLVRLLGKGGMGSVWVAEHLTLKTLVAVKFMAENFAQSPGATARFEREAVASSQIKSPHVVQVFDHGVDAAGVPYIVMELLEGEDLAHRLAAVGHLSPMQTAQIVGQVCKALSKAHAAQIVHRDIKADNIFLLHSDDDVFVKVLDFGIAKRHDDAPNSHLTSTGAVVGTPHTMSPEQILSSKHVDFRSDLWSVGVVAYQCITGALPFDGDTFGAIAIAIDRATFPPASTRCPGLPPQLDAWFSRALSRDLDGRFGSAREMSDELFKAVGIIRSADTGDSSISGARAPSGVVSANSTSADPTLAPATLPSGKGSAARVRLVAGAAVAVLLAGIGLFAVLRDDAPTPVAPESSHGAAPVAPAATQAPSVAPAALPIIETAAPPTPEPPPSASSNAPSRPQSAVRGPAKGARAPAEPSQHKPVPTKPPQSASEERDRGF